MSCKIQLKAMISITPPPYLAMFQKAFKNPLITLAIFFSFSDAFVSNTNVQCTIP